MLGAVVVGGLGQARPAPGEHHLGLGLGRLAGLLGHARGDRLGRRRLDGALLPGERCRRGLGPAAVVLDVDQHDGDVVAPAALVGQAHQLVGGVVGVGEAAQHGGDLVLGDLVRQAVAAQQEAVAGEGQHGAAVDRDVDVDPERPRDDVALRVVGRLLGGEQAVAHEVLDQAVVLAELDQAVVAVQVQPGVADVDPADLVALGPVDHPHRAERGAHAVELAVVAGPLEDRPVRGAHRVLQGVEVRAGAGLGDHRHRHRRCDLAALVAADAVGHAEQVLVGGDELGVLVGRPDLADVGGAPGAQGGHRGSPITRAP